MKPSRESLPDKLRTKPSRDPKEAVDSVARICCLPATKYRRQFQKVLTSFRAPELYYIHDLPDLKRELSTKVCIRELLIRHFYEIAVKLVIVVQLVTLYHAIHNHIRYFQRTTDI